MSSFESRWWATYNAALPQAMRNVADTNEWLADNDRLTMDGTEVAHEEAYQAAVRAHGSEPVTFAIARRKEGLLEDFSYADLKEAIAEACGCGKADGICVRCARFERVALSISAMERRRWREG